MERTIFYVFFVTVLIKSVVIKGQGNMCVDGLGTCDNCDQKCKTKHGPSSQGSCDRSVGVPLCSCYYQCQPPSPPSPPPPKTCNSGTSLCTEQCSDKSCDMNCAKAHSGGSGICNSIGNTRLCQCQYPC